MMFFKNRKSVRDFAKSSNRKVVDMGTTAEVGKRWAVKVF